MTWFNNLAISKKLWLSTGLFFVFLGMILAVSLWVSSRLASDLDLLTNRYFVANESLLEADSHLYRAISAERTLLFIKYGTPRFLNMKTFHKQNIDTALERLANINSLLATTDIAQQVKPYQTSFNDWRTLSNKVIELREQNTKESRRAASSLSLNEASQTFASMHDILDENAKLLRSNIEMVRDRANEHRVNSANALIGVTVLVVALGTLLTLLSISGIADPIKQLTFRLQQIATGDGDLTQRLESDRLDEIGNVGTAFNEFASKQSNLILQIKFSVNEFLEMMKKMGVNMGSLNESTLSQHRENNLLAQSMEQMACAIREVAEIAVKTEDATNISGTLAKQGHKIVTDSLTYIEKITNSIDVTSGTITELDGKAQNINSVCANIAEIAAQTNLLSLNAAIEAARAGESGRGFAVVADEVRDLAIKTENLTKQINSSIEELISCSTHSVEAMQQSLNDSKILAAKAKESDEALVNITKSVDEVMGLTHMLASAAEEQALTTESVSLNVSNLGTMATDSDKLATMTLTEVDSLRTVATTINNLLSKFKIENE